MNLELVDVRRIKSRPAPDSSGLEESLGMVGQRDPINVRPLTENGFDYEIVSGNRRFHSLVQQNAEKVWVVILEVDNMEFALDGLILNSGTPNFMDEADHIKELIERHSHSKTEIAQTVGWSLSTVQQRVDLYEKLIDKFQEKLRWGEITYSATINLVKLPKHRQKEFLERMEKEIELGDKTKITARDCQEEYRDYRDAKAIALLTDIADDTPTPTVSPDDPKLLTENMAVESLVVEAEDFNDPVFDFDPFDEPTQDETTPLADQSDSTHLADLIALSEELSERKWAARNGKGDMSFIREVSERLNAFIKWSI